MAAAQVLTTAMNQYGVSMEDPIAASAEMARMMNVMAAAGQVGSAELPSISAVLQQCGMAAKAANVSFEETNAARALIQSTEVLQDFTDVDAEVVKLLTYKRIEIKSVQASYIFYVCKWLTHCDLIHYKPHLPN